MAILEARAERWGLKGMVLLMGVPDGQEEEHLKKIGYLDECGERCESSERLNP